MDAIKWIKNSKCEGRQMLSELVQSALNYKPDVLWIITDAQDPMEDLVIVERLLSDYTSKHVIIINCILTDNRSWNSMLCDVANTTGGRILNNKGEVVIISIPTPAPTPKIALE